MAGIYFHIPFCRKACTYCDFHFSTSLRGKDALLKAMHQELDDRSQEVTTPFRTIYFGGGTPSLLDKTELEAFIQPLSRTADAEITLEVNPDDVTAERIAEWLAIGINRLSIGIQSFLDDQLQSMGRAHNNAEAKNALQLISNAPFNSWSLDLIYGLPNLDQEAWKNTIQEALSYSPPHISAYCLTVEAGTALHHQVQEGRVQIPSNEVQAKQFELLVKELRSHDYLQYEISNFAQKGHLARHNTNYWKRVSYIGIGPSAHSFLGHQRRWNIANNARYIHAINAGEAYWEQEEIDSRTAANEQIMTGLRTMWGVDIAALKIPFSVAQQETIMRYSEQGSLKIQPDRLVLTPQGRLLADRIASDLFFLE